MSCSVSLPCKVEGLNSFPTALQSHCYDTLRHEFWNCTHSIQHGMPLYEYIFIRKPALGPTFRVYVNVLLMGSWCSPSPWLQLHTMRNTRLNCRLHPSIYMSISARGGAWAHHDLYWARGHIHSWQLSSSSQYWLTQLNLEHTCLFLHLTVFSLFQMSSLKYLPFISHFFPGLGLFHLFTWFVPFSGPCA